ncbi:MAG: hypothetical protein LBD23_20585 [Oscillospiraceae bacterium]|jgi:hypothetical protein|nr:hypothetical protein [Oscillospiraceae bacterium]
MTCFNCGAKLEKSDIFCIRCETPVLTEDDTALLHYAKQQTDDDEYGDTANYSDSMPIINVTPNFTSSLSGNISGQPSTSRYNESLSHSDSARSLKPELPEPEQTEPVKQKFSFPAIVSITIVVCFAIIGVVMYYLVFSPDTPNDVVDPDNPVINNNGNNGNNGSNGNDEDPQNTPDTTGAHQQVSSITITSGGRVQTEFHTRVSETISLSARIEPEGTDADVIWTSSDPDVLEVVATDQGGTEAQITGIIAGVADIIVRAGDIEIDFVVFIDDFPIHAQLEDAILNTNTEIWVVITWTSGPFENQSTIFERSGNVSQWIVDDASERSQVQLSFAMENNVFRIELPTSSRIYYLFADSTGYYRYPDGTDTDYFTWEFMTSQLDAQG